MNELTGPDRLVRRWLSAGARGLRWIRRVDLIEVTRTLATETRQSARSLAREPVYFAGVWLTLSIGLTASATMATVVYGVLLRPLPFPAAHELVRFGNAGTRAPDACCSSVSVADFLDIDRRVTSFAGLAAEMPERAVVSSGAFSERAAGQRITPNFLTVLGWSPRIGRNFDVEDGRPGAVSVVIISESMARRHFGGRAPIGQRLVIDLVPSTVIGVMPDALLLPGSPEFWVPLQWDAAAQIDRRHHNIEPIGRLKPGATITQAREELRHVFASLAADYPADDANRTIAVST
ncbi:MAG TPA: ABC transporter permease, partial [Vicinamibacterales bacterium]